jgi:uncharacterized membrane protein
VFVPIALATLITFLLSRFVTRLERWIGRIAAILVTVTVMFGIFAAASWVIGRQLIGRSGKRKEIDARRSGVWMNATPRNIGNFDGAQLQGVSS